ncbi:MAG: acyl-CoA mutase large subunit family protein [Opitutales bacterium]|nr:acyl-CoA mutase large subunit family protein [Opitutales bacterium]
MKQEKLFGEFHAPTYDEWKKEAEALLKGAPFDKKMLTKTPEGIVLQPIYNKADGAAEPSLPGSGNYVRGISAGGYKAKPWAISQEMYAATPADFNAKILDALNKGQTSVELVFDERTQAGLDADSQSETKVGKGGLSASVKADIEKALKGVEAGCVEINVFAGLATPAIAAMLYSAFEGKKFSGGFYFDPVSELAKSGELPVSIGCALNRMHYLASYNAKNQPNMGAIGVNTLAYSESGASAVEELGAAFATAVFYIRAMLDKGMQIDEVAPLVRFRLSLGSNFFTEIAKIRAARAVWSKIIEEFGGNAEARKMRISARTTKFNKTVFDPYVNMLRGTTEAFSGIIGGVESMTVAPFDEVVRKPDEFSMRIARNTQIVLQEECNLCDVVDPAGGSYFVEDLTNQIAEKAWALFAEIEAQGGILKALESGFLQGKIAETAAGRKKLYDSRRSVVVGTNSYANLLEKPLAKRQCKCAEIAAERAEEVKKARKDADFSADGGMEAIIQAVKNGASVEGVCRKICSCGGAKVSVKALDIHRAVEHFEALRNASAAFKAKSGSAPKIFLATMGPLVQHKARADFIRGFFEVGGFDVIYPKGFSAAADAAKAFAESGAKYAVICSTDATYPELVPDVARALKGAKEGGIVLLAGVPDPQFEPAYKEAGLDGSISIKSNNYETLKAFLADLGVI